MRRKPLDTGSAMAMGVDHLLREYRHLRTNPGKFGQWVPPSGSTSGRKETTIWVASSEASPDIRSAADYVCDGTADEIEINAAFDTLDSLTGGIVQLSDGGFYCADGITVPSYCSLVGAGIYGTSISSTADGSGAQSSFIRATGTWGRMSDFSVFCAHDNYEFAVDTGIGAVASAVLRVGATMTAPGTDLYGAFSIGKNVRSSDLWVMSSNRGYGIYSAAYGPVRITNCVVEGATAQGNGADVGIYTNLTGPHILIGNIVGSGCAVGITVNNDNAILVGNWCANGITLTSFADGTILDDNYGTITDNGTNTKIGLTTGDIITDEDAIHDNVAGEIAAITAKATPVSGDILLIEDSEATNAKKKITIGDLPGGTGGGLDLTTKGDLHSFTTVDAALAVGLDGEALFADSGEATGLNWRDIVEADISDLNHTDTSAIHDDVASEISAITAKATPTTSDFLLIEDAAAANVKKRITIGDLPGGSGLTSPLTTKGDLWGFDTDDARLPVGTDTYVLTADSAETLGVKWVAAGSGTDGDAIHDNVAGEIAAITAKATPTTSDILLIEDAAASNAKKKITIGDLPGGTGGTNTLFAVNGVATVASTSAYATKGNFVRPRADLKIHAVTYYGSIVSGASYRAYVITYSGTTVSTVTAGTVYTADANDVGTAGGSASPTLRLIFATPPTLTAGTEYLVAVGRTDSTDTYILPTQYPDTLGGFPFSAYLPVGSGRVAKAAPAASDTMNVYSSGVVRMGVEWEWA